MLNLQFPTFYPCLSHFCSLSLPYRRTYVRFRRTCMIWCVCAWCMHRPCFQSWRSNSLGRQPTRIMALVILVVSLEARWSGQDLFKTDNMVKLFWTVLQVTWSLLQPWGSTPLVLLIRLWNVLVRLDVIGNLQLPINTKGVWLLWLLPKN